MGFTIVRIIAAILLFLALDRCPCRYYKPLRFVKEKLDRLAKRRNEIESGIQTLDEMIGDIEQEAVNRELVNPALNKISDVFDHIQPHYQEELLSLFFTKPSFLQTKKVLQTK